MKERPKKGEIYLAQLDPIVGSEQSGKRPVLVVSGDLFNQRFNLSVIVPISSSVKNYKMCTQIKKDNVNNLKSDSEILDFQVRCVSHNRFIKKIGNIGDLELKDVLFKINEVFTY